MPEPLDELAEGPVRLRRVREGDAPTVDRIVTAARDHLLPWMPWVEAHDAAAAEEFVRRSELAWLTGAEYNYLIHEPAEQADPLGCCALMRRIEPGGLEIGYWLSPHATGRGLATRAAAALCRQAFVFPDTTHVEIRHDAANTASAAVPARLGFTRTTTRPDPTRPATPASSGTTVVWRLPRPTALP